MFLSVQCQPSIQYSSVVHPAAHARIRSEQMVSVSVVESSAVTTVNSVAVRVAADSEENVTCTAAVLAVDENICTPDNLPATQNIIPVDVPLPTVSTFNPVQQCCAPRRACWYRLCIDGLCIGWGKLCRNHYQPAHASPSRSWNPSHSWLGILPVTLRGSTGKALALLTPMARQRVKNILANAILAGQFHTWNTTQSMITRYLKRQKLILKASLLHKPASIFRRL